VHALDKHTDVAVGLLQALHDDRNRSQPIDFVGLGVVDLGVALGGEKQALARFHGALESGHRPGPADHERHHHPREDDDVP